MLNFLEQRILRDGVSKTGDVIKVGSFLNHQIDIDIVRNIGMEFKRRFDGCGATKILTVEASGIALAIGAAMYFDIPVLFAKKSQTLNSDGEKYVAEAYSYTHQCLNHIYIEKAFLTSTDKVLIIDDFLARGSAVKGLTELVRQAGAQVVGIGIAVEKGFQEGGKNLRAQGYHLESIAIIDGIDSSKGTINFKEH